jgi:hypothetical protein
MDKLNELANFLGDQIEKLEELLENNGIDVTRLTNVQVDPFERCISYAEIDGEPVTDDELEEINEDRDFVYEQCFEQLNN